jgi:hypothetical protein
MGNFVLIRFRTPVQPEEARPSKVSAIRGVRAQGEAGHQMAILSDAAPGKLAISAMKIVRLLLAW